jgi:hypothetical protein
MSYIFKALFHHYFPGKGIEFFESPEKSSFLGMSRLAPEVKVINKLAGGGSRKNSSILGVTGFRGACFT